MVAIIRNVCKTQWPEQNIVVMLMSIRREHKWAYTHTGKRVPWLQRSLFNRECNNMRRKEYIITIIFMKSNIKTSSAIITHHPSYAHTINVFTYSWCIAHTHSHCIIIIAAIKTIFIVSLCSQILHIIKSKIEIFEFKSDNNIHGERGEEVKERMRCQKNGSANDTIEKWINVCVIFRADTIRLFVYLFYCFIHVDNSFHPMIKVRVFVLLLDRGAIIFRLESFIIQIIRKLFIYLRWSIDVEFGPTRERK